METSAVILAGGTGNLGHRITRALVARRAAVRALVRKGSGPEKTEPLKGLGIEVVPVDFNRPEEMEEACSGGTCVVSALSGLREVIVETQTRLLEAAVRAGVPRFIPSDFSIDFTKLSPGTNRNLDLRREFMERLNRAEIAATSVLNGMFADLLTGQAPFILFKWKRVVYWENPDQPLDFTTIENTAEYTAAAALDPTTPRFLRIAGDTLSARDLARVAGEVTGQEFRLLRAGSLKRLEGMIKILRTLFPQPRAIYPPWQGMQYTHNMFTGLPKLDPLDNDRYPEIRWTKVREVLAERGKKG